MHTRTRSEYKSFADSVYPKPNFCQRYCQYVLLLLFDANTDSGDVICIQGRDLSTNHLFILFIQNPNQVRPVCQDVSLLLFDAKTDSGDVICIQGRDLSTNHLLILFFQNPISINSPITVRPVCQNVSWLLFDANTDIVEMSYAYKDEIWVQIICLFCLYPKPNFCQRYCQNVLWLLFDANTDSGDVICIQGRDLSTNHLWFCSS
jgi:hypothetical protein